MSHLQKAIERILVAIKLQNVKKLEEVGFTKPQAEMLIKMMEEIVEEKMSGGMKNNFFA